MQIIDNFKKDKHGVSTPIDNPKEYLDIQSAKAQAMSNMMKGYESNLPQIEESLFLSNVKVLGNNILFEYEDTIVKDKSKYSSSDKSKFPKPPIATLLSSVKLTGIVKAVGEDCKHIKVGDRVFLTEREKNIIKTIAFENLMGTTFYEGTYGMIQESFVSVVLPKDKLDILS